MLSEDGIGLYAEPSDDGDMYGDELNAPTVDPQKIVTIPPELIEKLASCVVDIVGNIDWNKAIEAYKARPHGEWIITGEEQGASGSWEPIEDTDEVMCSRCFSRLKNKTSQGQTFKICPMCGVYINNV